MKLVSVCLAVALLGLVGCATQHSISSSTPRSVEIVGPAFTSSDNQKAFSLAENECQKHGRHAALTRDGGSKPNAFWTFNCVQ